MKKNRMMRLASVLLVLTLLSTSVISGTFAKYVTTVGARDEARVARWGFTGKNTDIAITDLFKETYDKNVDGYADVIAPGTTNTAKFQFVYSATGDGTSTPDSVAAPEVAYTVTVSTDGSVCDAKIKANNNIKWAVCKTVDLDTEGKVKDGEWKSWDEMIAEIKSLAGNNTVTAANGVATHAANTLPYITEEYTIAWKWDFVDAANTNTYDHDNDPATAALDQNQYDTYMGNMNELDDVIIQISITATQVD